MVSAEGAVVWLTGLSGSGKSTIAAKLADTLREKGRAVEELDGDAIRTIFPQTGFSREERNAHVRRVGYLASRLAHHGVIAIAALISPYEESRQFVRGLCDRLLMVHVSTPLEECERRDVKGLYARARSGAITNFTGIDDPFEVPEHADLTLDTRFVTVDEAVLRIIAKLEG